MKQALILLIASALLFSCGEQTVEKPERLLSEDQMVNILYDISLIQAISSYDLSVLEKNKVEGRNYIFTKYKTDSLTFAQNEQYYASDLEKYESIQKKLVAKVEAQKKALGVAPKQGNKPVIRPRTRTVKANGDNVKPASSGKALRE